MFLIRSGFTAPLLTQRITARQPTTARHGPGLDRADGDQASVLGRSQGRSGMLAVKPAAARILLRVYSLIYGSAAEREPPGRQTVLTFITRCSHGYNLIHPWL